MLRYNLFFRNSFLLLDLLVLNATCFLSGYFVFTQNGLKFPFFWTQYILIVNLLWLFLTSQTRYYFTELTFILIIRKTVGIIFLYLLLLICYYLIFHDKQRTNEFFMIQILLQVFLIFFSRYIFIKTKEKIKPINYDKRRALIVGESVFPPELADRFSRPDSGYTLLGYHSYLFFGDTRKEVSLYEKLCQIINYAIAHKVSEIFLMDLPKENIDWKSLMKLAEENLIRLKFIPNYDNFFSQKTNLSIEYGFPVISLRKEPLEKIENRIIKKIFDIAFSVFILFLMLWWLIPFLAILIKFSSKGPVFFVQKRSGRNGKVFNCYKLRSMYLNEDADSKEAIRDDERFTPIGKILRRTNLDELPQFFNVLKGEMSIIGPRPHMLKHTEEYSQIVDQFMVRHFLKPGLTGWAQVNGFRGDLTGTKMHKRVELDVWYLENWNFYLDLKIIIQTLYVTIKGDKNAF